MCLFLPRDIPTERLSLGLGIPTGTCAEQVTFYVRKYVEGIISALALTHLGFIVSLRHPLSN